MIYIFHHYNTTYEQAKFKASEAYLYRVDLTGMSRLLHSTAAENAHFSQAHMEHSPKETTFWAMNHTVTNWKEWKSYDACSPSTEDLN